jgi:hypothetical protein
MIPCLTAMNDNNLESRIVPPQAQTYDPGETFGPCFAMDFGSAGPRISFTTSFQKTALSSLPKTRLKTKPLHDWIS